jgi:hypothetical protein
MGIKRKTSKRTKISLMRKRRNPEPEILIKERGRISERQAKTKIISYIDMEDFLKLFDLNEREDIEDMIEEFDFTFGDTDLALVNIKSILPPSIFENIKQYGITSSTFLNL